MKRGLVLALTIVLAATAAALGAANLPLQQSRKLSTSHFKNEPVEIVSITLDGKEVKPNDTINASPGWPQRLELKVKNISDKPVSWIQFSASTVSSDPKIPASFNTSYFLPHRLLQPNEVTTLTPDEIWGDEVSDEPVEILLQRVMWNNDPAVIWSAGKLLKYDPASHSYKPDEAQLAKYRLPREYQLRMKKVRFDDPPFCSESMFSEPTVNCLASNPCGDPPKCQTWTISSAYNLIHNDVRPQAVHKKCTGCGGIVQCPGYQTAYEHTYCVPIGDPIIVDTLRNGYALTDAQGGVGFDLFNIGRNTVVSWTAPNSDDMFLVLDRNSNGIIDNGSELFGNVTPQPTIWGATNGFLALAQYDKAANGGNGDGAISAQDTVFNRLRLWQDANHNGFSEAGELFSLNDARITSLDLQYKEAKRTDEYGNAFRYRAKVDGLKTSRWAWDVYFTVN